MFTAKKSTRSSKEKPSRKVPLRERLLLLLAEHPAGLTRHEIVDLGIPNGARKTAREEEIRDTRLFERVKIEGVRGDTFRITPEGKKEVAKLSEMESPDEGHSQKLTSRDEFKGEKVDEVIGNHVPQAIDIDDPPPGRVKYKINRIIRDTAKARHLKELHKHRCQILDCDDSICNGIYSEAHHIKPLGGNAPGPDSESNILVLCPNHHAMCDLALLPLDLSNLRLDPKHQISQAFIDYHNGLVEARRIQ